MRPRAHKGGWRGIHIRTEKPGVRIAAAMQLARHASRHSSVRASAAKVRFACGASRPSTMSATACLLMRNARTAVTAPQERQLGAQMKRAAQTPALTSAHGGGVGGQLTQQRALAHDVASREEHQLHRHLPRAGWGRLLRGARAPAKPSVEAARAQRVDKRRAPWRARPCAPRRPAARPALPAACPPPQRKCPVQGRLGAAGTPARQRGGT